MHKFLLPLVLLPWALCAEVITLTLPQVIELAAKQNPDVALARLNELKIEQDVRQARAPFVPSVFAGSGAAYATGMPMSIDNVAPSIFQVNATSNIVNRPQSYRAAAAREIRHGAAVETELRQEEVAQRAAELFLDAIKAGRFAGIANQQVANLQIVAGTIQARIEEGRELPIESKRAAVNLARSRQRLEVYTNQQQALEDSLASVLGLAPGDQIRLADEPWSPPPLPASETAAVAEALAHSRDLRLLETQLAAKGFDIRAEKAARLPRLDLVAQYALLSRYNYEDFFQKFQRHNLQLGISFQIPIFTGPAVNAAVAKAENESAQLRLQVRSTRDRVAGEARRLYNEVRQAETAREVARLDLDVSREQVSLLLAQMEEGRAGLRQVEEARVVETDKWITFYDAVYSLEKARVALLRITGSLLAAVK